MPLIKDRVVLKILLISFIFFCQSQSNSNASQLLEMYNFGVKPVKIYQSQSTKSKVVGLIKKGEKVEVIMVKKKWAIVYLNGGKAFVRSKDIRKKVSFKKLFGKD